MLGTWHQALSVRSSLCLGHVSRVTCHVSRAEAGYENWPGMEWWERFSGGLAWPPNMEEEDMNWN